MLSKIFTQIFKIFINFHKKFQWAIHFSMGNFPFFAKNCSSHLAARSNSLSYNSKKSTIRQPNNTSVVLRDKKVEKTILVVNSSLPMQGNPFEVHH